eukprot:s16_g44.t1
MVVAVSFNWILESQFGGTLQSRDAHFIHGPKEFIEGEDCCNMTSKKLRLKGTRETVEFITSASRKRWAHVCGDYCDDITAVLIQWNAPTPLEGGSNHCLTVRQFQPPSTAFHYFPLPRSGVVRSLAMISANSHGSSPPVANVTQAEAAAILNKALAHTATFRNHQRRSMAQHGVATVDARAKPPRAPIAVGDRQAGDEDTIASSNKKARAPVEYTPATLEEYKQRFGGKADYSELGRLGPDLDDEDLLMKRAIQEKVKEFSRELHRVNKHRAAKAQPKHEPKADPKPTARAKVLRPQLKRLISNPRSITALLKALSCPDVAVKVLDVLQDGAGLAKVNLFHFSALLGVCERRGSWQLAVQILSQMRAARQVADVLCYMPALRACQKMSAWVQALQLFQSMSGSQASPDAICYNAMIGSAKAVGSWPLAVALLAQMCGASIVPSSIIAGTVMSACQDANEWRSVLQLLAQLPHLSLQPDLICFNIAISCESPGAWRISLSCLSEILRRSLQVSQISFNSAITACGKAAQWQAAVELLWQMPSTSLTPDVISYNAAVAACTQHWQMALEIFSQMLPAGPVGPRSVSRERSSQDGESRPRRPRIFSAFSQGALVSPDLITYNAVVSACEKGGQWALALSIFNQMELGGSELPNCVTYQGLLSACERESQWEVGLQVLDHMLKQQEMPSAMHVGSAVHALVKEKGEASGLMLLDAFRSPWKIDGQQPVAPSHPEVMSSRPGIVVACKDSGISTEAFVARLAAQLKMEPLSIVSRLDYPTSGVLPLAVGENSPADHWVRAQFAGRLVRKEYLCLCEGPALGEVGTRGNISAPLQSVQIDDDTWQSEVYDEIEEGSSAWGISGAAMEALTLYEVVERYHSPHSPISDSNSSNSELMYLKVWPKTGRRHQIRVHLASLGRPLVGDLTYGRGEPPLVDRLFLHCRAVQFLDLQRQQLRVEAPVPWELAQAMQFAKNIPKPKLLPPKQVLVTPTKPLEEDQARQEAVEWEDLRRRERQHLEDVARIAEVKQLLERLAV